MQLNVNIGIFGCVSVGKSTFLNAITGRQYSDVEIKKTTMVPQVYIESEGVVDHSAVRDENRAINEFTLNLIEASQFDLDKCEPFEHYINRIDDLFDPAIIDPKLKMVIYDIPGLNDSISKNIYFEWVRQNIKIFHIIIFMTDVTKGLNNADEIDILNLLMRSMVNTRAKMICLMNKCDDIYYDAEQNDLVFEEKEQESIYLQANNILADVAKTNGLENDFTPFIPISSENCFIYRALKYHHVLDVYYQNKLCRNECGANQWKKMKSDEKKAVYNNIIENLESTYDAKILDTGYLSVKNIIQSTIINNNMEFITNHIDYEMNELIVVAMDAFAINDYITLVNKYKSKLEAIESIIGEVSYETFWKNIMITITQYINSIVKINTKIINGRYFIDFRDFDNLHTFVQNKCINFLSLIEVLKPIRGYPVDFIKEKLNLIASKFISIYEQLNSIEAANQLHISPINLLYYLQIINTYIPSKFDTYAQNFLDIVCNTTKLKYIISNERQLMTLIEYISKNITDPTIFLKQICHILLNKQVFLTNQNRFHFYYLVKLKELIKPVMTMYLDNSVNKCYALCVLCEVIEKNISVCLGTNNVYNIYKQDINNEIVNQLIVESTNVSVMPEMEFEKCLVGIISSFCNVKNLIL